MRKKLSISLAVTMFALAFARVGLADSPALGEHAPDFRLQDQQGDWHELDDYAGEWVALFFYPKDDTPGCTTEACAFRDDIFKFKRLGVKIVGISVDDVASHQAFASKYKLPFALLADTDKKTVKDYGVLKSYGLFKAASRETFLIDPQGHIVKHYAKVKSDQHSGEVLADLQALIADAES